MENKQKIAEKLQEILNDNEAINELLLNPRAFAEKNGIEDKDSFVKGVDIATNYIPDEALSLIQKNPYAKLETKEMFRKYEQVNINDSQTVPVTVMTVVVALTIAVAAGAAATKLKQ
jgi:hypothetical protein